MFRSGFRVDTRFTTIGSKTLRPFSFQSSPLCLQAVVDNKLNAFSIIRGLSLSLLWRFLATYDPVIHALLYDILYLTPD